MKWENLDSDASPRAFPEADLMEALMKIYFDQINPLFGVLHSPSFRTSLADGLHLRDRNFGSLVLVVCALGSRYSDDPRVFLDGEYTEHSCGWKWFCQVEPFKALSSLDQSLHRLQWITVRTAFSAIPLYNIQTHAQLSVLYLAGTSNPAGCW